MKLIVGLGNPGKKYEKTRHNLGYLVADHLADISKIDVDREVFRGLLGRGQIFDEDVMIFKPTTFMNLSGEAVREISNYFKIKPDDVIVIYDDMALPVGQIRLRLKGSSGSHKGMQNIIDNLKTENLQRIRIGIGEPPYGDAKDYVLGTPSKEEWLLLDDAIERSAKAILDILKIGSFEKVMSKYN